MHLVERMTQAPPNCMVCGAGNTPDGVTGEIGPFLDLERDVNWGDSTYLCMLCCTQIGAHAGLMTAEEKQSLEAQIRKLKTQVHSLEAERSVYRRRERAAGLRARADAVETL